MNSAFLPSPTQGYWAARLDYAVGGARSLPTHWDDLGPGVRAGTAPSVEGEIHGPLAVAQGSRCRVPLLLRLSDAPLSERRTALDRGAVRVCELRVVR